MRLPRGVRSRERARIADRFVESVQLPRAAFKAQFFAPQPGGKGIQFRELAFVEEAFDLHLESAHMRVDRFGAIFRGRLLCRYSQRRDRKV